MSNTLSCSQTPNKCGIFIIGYWMIIWEIDFGDFQQMLMVWHRPAELPQSHAKPSIWKWMLGISETQGVRTTWKQGQIDDVWCTKILFHVTTGKPAKWRIFVLCYSFNEVSLKWSQSQYAYLSKTFLVPKSIMYQQGCCSEDVKKIQGNFEVCNFF